MPDPGWSWMGWYCFSRRDPELDRSRSSWYERKHMAQLDPWSPKYHGDRKTSDWWSLRIWQCSSDQTTVSTSMMSARLWISQRVYSQFGTWAWWFAEGESSWQRQPLGLPDLAHQAIDRSVYLHDCIPMAEKRKSRSWNAPFSLRNRPSNSREAIPELLSS